MDIEKLKSATTFGAPIDWGYLAPAINELICAYETKTRLLGEAKDFIQRCETWFARYGDKGHRGEANRIAKEISKSEA